MNQKQKTPLDNAEEDGGQLIPSPKKKSNLQKRKVPIDNVEEDGGELIPSPKKKSNLYKHSAIHFHSLAYF